MLKKELFKLDLKHFDDGGASGATGTGEGSTMGEESNAVAAKQQKGRNPLANVKYGKQDMAQAANVQITEEPAKEPETLVTTKETEAIANKVTDFENLIKGDFKDEFNNRVQEIINKRFKDTKELETKVQSVSPVLDLLSKKYGVDPSDIENLVKAVQDDDAFYEKEAMARGMDVAQFKEIRKIELENEYLKREQLERQRQESADLIYKQWMDESEKLREVYPNFDFNIEAENEDFAKLIQAGIDVKNAYEVIHKDEIMGGAMYHTAQTISKKMADNIQSRASRPIENGIASQTGITVKSDVNSLSKKDREEIERRVARGERISF